MEKLLSDIMHTQSVTYHTKAMRKLINRYAKMFGCKVTSDRGNIYCTKGNASLYPCIVAHTDTVHALIPERDFDVMGCDQMIFGFDKGRNDFSGIGGDDKVGIYIALCVLREFDYCKAAFFRDEEIGCAGSAQAQMPFFDDCSFVLMCDRKGNKDFVNDICFTKITSDEFDDAILPVLASHGYSFAEGMLTDVAQLKWNGLKVCCANMSCGYYNPHSKDEFINLADMNNCKAMVYELIKQFGDQQWKHEATERVYSDDYYEGQSVWNDSEDWERVADLKYSNRNNKKKKNKHRTYVPKFPKYEKIPVQQCKFCGDGHLEYDRDMMDYYCGICNAYQDNNVQETEVMDRPIAHTPITF